MLLAILYSLEIGFYVIELQSILYWKSIGLLAQLHLYLWVTLARRQRETLSLHVMLPLPILMLNLMRSSYKCYFYSLWFNLTASRTRLPYQTFYSLTIDRLNNKHDL